MYARRTTTHDVRYTYVYTAVILPCNPCNIIVYNYWWGGGWRFNDETLRDLTRFYEMLRDSTRFYQVTTRELHWTRWEIPWNTELNTRVLRNGQCETRSLNVEYCIQCTVNIVHYTVYSVHCSLHYTMYTIRLTLVLQIVNVTSFYKRSKHVIYDVMPLQCTLYMYIMLYSVHCTLYIVQCIVKLLNIKCI